MAGCMNSRLLLWSVVAALAGFLFGYMGAGKIATPEKAR